jgi:hypothetical protein
MTNLLSKEKHAKTNATMDMLKLKTKTTTFANLVIQMVATNVKVTKKHVLNVLIQDSYSLKKTVKQFV